MNEKFTFFGGTDGLWRVTSFRAERGQSLDPVERVAIVEGDGAGPQSGVQWTLSGLTSGPNYATEAELAQLRAKQPALGRPEATRAALIPIRKSPSWWALGPAARRELFEEISHHNAIGMEYLAAIARRLHHCRELGGPFDFLTWFEFAPEHEAASNALVARLRATPEWKYVDREVDFRLERARV